MTVLVTASTTQPPTLNDAVYSGLQLIENGERIRTCLQCGTCSGICPFGHLMDYPPGKMIAALRAGAFERVVNSDSVWMCVSCYACTQVCPAQIPLTPGLMTRAKEEMLLAGNVPEELQHALQFSQRYGNPLGESPRKRAAWTKGLDPPATILGKAKRPVDVLWFVGDYPSYHPRVQRTARALAKILAILDVDFGILGREEQSDADSQRLAGERGLFEMLAEKNGRAFAKYQFGEIITTDPHAYNALKNEYPALGISYPVRHYTQFLAERIDQLKPHLRREVKARITFHDPCYLGRANGVYDEPRALLEAIPGVTLVEMFHHRQTSLCCGGGGGGMWLDGFQWEKARSRISEWRVQEAIKVNADILAVACPYETPRFEDAVKTAANGAHLVVKDIAELLAESLDIEEE
ncbi:MAG TPA: (Fe-S)-binding protein [Caldilineae bacterium]|nr:(Fe-S)-binding protein [Caldilineae bacterium]